MNKNNSTGNYLAKKVPLKQFFLIMRTTLVLLFTCVFCSMAEMSYTQNARVTINKRNATLKEVLNEIESQTDYLFIYNDEVNTNNKVSVRATQKAVSEVLNSILDNKDINYSMEGNHILLSKEENISSEELSTLIAQQQKKQITGTVVDESGIPIIGANIIEQGTTNGTITDIDGNFNLSIEDGAVIHVSYIGYLNQDIITSGRNNFNITLQEDTQTLDELIVVGYGAVRKADLTGAISVLDNRNFRDQPVTEVSEILQGRVAGVQVTNSGIPGGDVKIRVRGSGSINRSNEPLYVIDGIVRESGLTGLNTEDIQSMQVLKDASSTAIYGSRGANGVVLITTKTGRANVNQIIFDSQIGFGSVAKQYDVLNAYDFATAFNTYRPNTFSQEDLSSFQNGTKGTNWQNEIFQTGMIQNYRLSFSSGSDKTQFYISGNYMDHDGVVIENNNKRYQARVNVTSKLTEWLNITADVNASHNIRRSGNFSASKGNIVTVAMNYAPVVGIQDESGYFYRDQYNALLSMNPVGRLKEEMGETMRTIVNGRVDLQFNILPGLTYVTTNGIDYSDSKSYSFNTTKVSTRSSLSNQNHYNRTLQSTNNLTYMGNWGDHSLTATAVYEATTSQYRQMGISGSNLMTESGNWWNINMATSRSSSNNYSEWSLMSGVGRILYNYGDRYLLTGTFRADGSSRFSNNKWGYFPSLAFAWNAGNEEFIKRQNFIQNLKLRASYGIVGSQAIGPYETLGLMSQTQYAFGGNSQYTGFWLGTSIPTPDLTWETSNQFNLGVDFSLFDGSLSFNIDYFDKKTKDGLLKKAIPNYDGGGSYWVNTGEISNKGLDVYINSQIIENKNFTWNSAISMSYLKNNVVSLGGMSFVSGTTPATGMIPPDGVTRVEVGQPIGSFYGYQWTGLDENGRDTYADLDGSNTFNSNDRTFIGKATPDLTLGWNNSLNWKNWDLNFFFTGAFGADRLNLVHFTGATLTGDFAFISLQEAWEDSFDRKGQSARHPSVNVTGNNYQAASTKWLEKADYLRLDNLSLSYNLPKSVSEFADFRFTLSCQNLFTISGYKGLDPAGSSFSTGNWDINDGIDLGAYPLSRTFTIGVRMNF